MECKNCGNHFEGHFCNVCGQSSAVGRLTLPGFLREVSESVFELNRGLLFTLKNLLVRPGHGIREFLEGKRVYYYKPVAYALVLSTIYYLITQIFDADTFMGDVVGGFQRGKRDAMEVEAGSQDIINDGHVFNWLIDNFSYSSLLVIPMYALASYLVFRRKGHNYLEHMVLNAYVQGQHALFYLSSVILGAMTNQIDLFVSIAFTLSILYRYWVFIQFYHTNKIVTVIVRLTFTYVIFFIILVLVLGLLAVIDGVMGDFY